MSHRWVWVLGVILVLVPLWGGCRPKEPSAEGPGGKASRASAPGKAKAPKVDPAAPVIGIAKVEERVLEEPAAEQPASKESGPTEDVKTQPGPGRERVTFQAGDPVTIDEVSEDKVIVRTPTGQRVELKPAHLCSAKELKRRQGAGEVPERLICIGQEGGKLVMFGGSISIGGGRPTAETGQAFWMNPSAKGASFTIASNQVQGDPGVIFLVKADGSVAKLEVWKGK